MRTNNHNHLVKGMAVFVLVAVSAAGIGFGQAASAHVTGTDTPREQKVAKAKTYKAAKAHKRSIPGKVISFDGTTLVMVKGNKTYTVTTDASTSFVDRKWKAIDKNQIVAGHRVTVKGMVTGMNVAATSVRDIKLPVKSVSTTD